MKDDFHKIAFKSILFKGRSDWYFCYLKSEKIAHVLIVLAQRSPFKDRTSFSELVSFSTQVPHTILKFVAGEIDAAMILADILSILSFLRLAASEGSVSRENMLILVDEYENIARKIAAENHPSPFVSSEDFAVEEIATLQESKSLFAASLPSPGKRPTEKSVKDINKGHSDNQDKGQNERASLILDFVAKNKGVSIKEIAAVVRGCSEKTIQRELGSLIQQGLVERRGERRWSTYTAARPTTL